MCVCLFVICECAIWSCINSLDIYIRYLPKTNHLMLEFFYAGLLNAKCKSFRHKGKHLLTLVTTVIMKVKLWLFIQKLTSWNKFSTWWVTLDLRQTWKSIYIRDFIWIVNSNENQWYILFNKPNIKRKERVFFIYLLDSWKDRKYDK